MGNATSHDQKKKKKSAANWFETLNVCQLKDLCKAAKLKLSGTKAQLCERLLSDEFTSEIGLSRQYALKENLKERLLIQSGNKFQQVLRIIQHEKGGGDNTQVKRAATETIIDEETGKEIQVLKKRKIVPKPQTMYIRIEKKMKAVSQKKYQTNIGSKFHTPDVFSMLSDLIQQFCIDSKFVHTDPKLAYHIAKAGFDAIYDHWEVLERVGYGGYEFECALSKLETVLKAVSDSGKLSSEEIEDMVVLLENINTCMAGYCINESYEKDAQGCFDYNGKKYNLLEKTIRTIMPNYDKGSRTTKPQNKVLEIDLKRIAWLNGIPYPNSSSKN